RPPAEGLPPVTGALRGLLPELAGLLPPAPPPVGDPRAEQHRLVRALCGLTTSLGRAVLVVEDVQWADDGTAAFLRTLVSDPPPHLGLVLTARGRDGDAFPLPLRPPSHVVAAERHLEPLSVAGTGALAGGLLGGRAVPGELAEELHRWTGGLPYVIEEMLRHRPDPLAQLTGADGDGAPEPPLPASVRRLVVEGLRRLPPDARKVASAAAVLDGPAPVHLLGAVAGLGEEETRRALTAALEEGVLRAAGDVGGGAYAFPYALARRAAYEAVPGPERPVLHLRAARALARHASPLPLVR
ncbi:LuxR family transcriptional regulator, partial [Streptomyces sp. ZEA17I]